MMAEGIFADEYHGVGGCYEIDASGKRVPVAAPAQDVVPAVEAAPAKASTKKQAAAGDAVSPSSTGA
jgi:hypothetical protein